MKNSLNDLNNHLFEQMERLNDDSLSDEELEKEMARGKAMSDVSKNIIENAKLMLDAAKLKTEYSRSDEHIPEVLQIEKRDNK